MFPPGAPVRQRDDNERILRRKQTYPQIHPYIQNWA